MRDGTRALSDVLLLGRHIPHEYLVAGMATALRGGALTADDVALEARDAAQAGESDRVLGQAACRRSSTHPGSEVASGPCWLHVSQHRFYLAAWCVVDAQQNLPSGQRHESDHRHGGMAALLQEIGSIEEVSPLRDRFVAQRTCRRLTADVSVVLA
ncbi:hypothetical protein ACFYZB_34880 [Streptomyces sp. NPDC001852]|uniref:hypothetical protein n=1 Tax=Streptomyces sp. NPDC001852 TaxID=3364619 RepID=UPI0036840D7E